MADANKKSTSRIAFTLPLSCQICLGKVKLPVVCPNQHVFCSPCMDVWLQRNQQCPTCRIPITDDNPCKKILGGLSQNEEEENNFAKTKELRRSRLELLCKDYEDEIERLQMENDTLKQEQQILEEQVKSYAAQKLKEAEDDVAKGKPSSSSAGSPQPDMNMLMMLTKKLQDATGLYERVKKDMDKLKQENSNVRDENAALTRENQRIRMELTERSPRKFGRFTVATLETKLERQEKEVKQLQKALERSDAYVEEVEKELETYRNKRQQQNTCIRCKCTLQVEKANETNKCEKTLTKKDARIDGDFVKKAEAWTVQLHQGSTSKDGGIAQGKFDSQKPSTSSEDWRKLPEDMEKDSRKESKALPDKTNEEKKKSMTVGSFYGKRPLVKESRPGANKSLPSHKGAVEKKSEDLNDTFELEMPSPTSSMFSSTGGENQSTLDQDLSETGSKFSAMQTTPNDSTIEFAIGDRIPAVSSSESCKKRLRFESDTPDTSGLSFLNSPKKGNGGKKTSSNGNPKQVTFNNNVSVKNMIRKRNAMSDSLLDVTLPSDTSEVDVLNDLKASDDQDITTDENYDVNMSMNSDIMDCMELFSGAEKRLGKKKNTKHEFEPTNNSNASRTDKVHEELPPFPSASDLTLTFPDPLHRNLRSQRSDLNFPPGPGFLSASTGNLTHNGRHGALPASYSSDTSHNTNSQTTKDLVSSSGDHLKTCPPSSRPYPDQNHVSSSCNANISSREHTSTLSNPSNFQAFSQHSGTNLGSKKSGSREAASYQLTSSVAGISGSSHPSTGPDSLMTQTFPARPASTATLQGMIHTLQSLDDETTARPLSAPGMQVSNSTANWNNNFAPSSISSTSDFRPGSSMSNMPPSSRSNFSGLSLSQGGMHGLPGGSQANLAGLQSGSQSTFPGLPGVSVGSMTGLAGGAQGNIAGLHGGSQGNIAGIPSGSHGNIAGLHGGMQGNITGLNGGSQGNIAGLLGGASGMSSNFSGSQSTLSQLPGFPNTQMGMPPVLPGGGGLSQPSGRYASDFNSGLFGLGGSSSFIPGFSGGMTQ